MFKKIKTFFQTSIHDSIDNIKTTKSLVRYRWQNMLLDRKENQAPLSQDFNLILEKWGLTEEQIPQVCKDLMARVYLYIFVLLIVILLFLNSSVIFGILLLTCAFLGISTALWRKSILEKRQFISYLHYLGLACLIPKKPSTVEKTDTAPLLTSEEKEIQQK